MHGFRILHPGFPVTDTRPSDSALYIVISTTARIIGPALQNRDIQSLLYHHTQSERLFRYLGKAFYKWKDSGRRYTIHL
jgi:hypothetical protein